MNKNKNAIAYNIGSANLIEPPWIRALLFNFKTFQFQLIKIILITIIFGGISFGVNSFLMQTVSIVTSLEQEVHINKERKAVLHICDNFMICID